jgi:hypothetical protein
MTDDEWAERVRNLEAGARPIIAALDRIADDMTRRYVAEHQSRGELLAPFRVVSRYDPIDGVRTTIETMRVCAECLTEWFAPEQSNHRYCSTRCRVRACRREGRCR